MPSQERLLQLEERVARQRSVEQEEHHQERDSTDSGVLGALVELGVRCISEVLWDTARESWDQIHMRQQLSPLLEDLVLMVPSGEPQLLLEALLDRTEETEEREVLFMQEVSLGLPLQTLFRHTQVMMRFQAKETFLSLVGLPETERLRAMERLHQRVELLEEREDKVVLGAPQVERMLAVL